MVTRSLKQHRDLVDTTIAEVMRYSVAKEMHVYPAMEKHLPRGRGKVEQDHAGHDGLVSVAVRRVSLIVGFLVAPGTGL